MNIDKKLTQINEEIAKQIEYIRQAKKGVEYRVNQPATDVWANSVISAVNTFNDEYGKLKILNAQKKLLLEIKEGKK